MKNIRIVNKLLFSVFFLILVFFIVLSFRKYFLQMDYVTFLESDCDPTKEQCFIGHCDPAYEECTGLEEEDTFYFKKIQILAKDIPQCNPEDSECLATVCEENNLKCTQTLCDSNDEESECSSLLIIN